MAVEKEKIKQYLVETQYLKKVRDLTKKYNYKWYQVYRSNNDLKASYIVFLAGPTDIELKNELTKRNIPYEVKG